VAHHEGLSIGTHVDTFIVRFGYEASDVASIPGDEQVHIKLMLALSLARTGLTDDSCSYLVSRTQLVVRLRVCRAVDHCPELVGLSLDLL
jgi:hypothetical protein